MHLLTLAICAMLGINADIFMNAMNAGSFATGEGTAYLVSYWAFVSIAVAFAISAPVISFFGDRRALNVAFMASTLSALLSVVSVHTATTLNAAESNGVMAERARLLELLDNKHDKIAACRADRYCVSEEMRKRMDGYEDELAALPKAVVAVDTGGIWYQFGYAVKIAIALFLPFINAELLRQIGWLVGGPSVRQRRSNGRSEHSQRSQPRNDPVISPEPEAKKDPPKQKRGTTQRIPTDAEHEQIRSAYQALKREGQDGVTVSSLRKKAGKSNAMVGWWLRNTDEETRMAGYEYGKNIVPIGPVVKT